MISILKPYRVIKRLFWYCYFKLTLGHFEWTSRIYSPLRISGGQNILISHNVTIQTNAWLAAVPLTGKESNLRILEGTSIGDFSHIYATQNILIESNVLIANFVYISDNIHGFEDINQPIIRQAIVQKKHVVIGTGTWIGEHVSVIGASVGKHCVIGANSVVTKDIPDYCVAVGAPAKIIKRYDFETQSWRKTLPNGEFVL